MIHSDRFNEIIIPVLLNEGSNTIDGGLYVRDGYHTKYGIAYEYNTKELAKIGIRNPDDIEHLQLSEAVSIYYHNYYLPSHAELIEDSYIRYQYLDHCVNAGRGAGAECIQAAINYSLSTQNEKSILVDGIVGPVTRAAMENKEILNDIAKLALISERIGYYKRVIFEKDCDSEYKKDLAISWTKRVVIEKGL